MRCRPIWHGATEAFADMFCSYCGRPNPEDALYCRACGRKISFDLPAPSASQSPKRAFDPTLIRLTVIANDMDSRLWTSNEVTGARGFLKKKYKQIPTLEDLSDWFGTEAVQHEVTDFVEGQARYLRYIQDIYSLDEKGEVCHKCGSAFMVKRYLFGLAEITSEKRTWLETAFSVALSAITLPTIGYGGLALPGKTTTARVLRLHLSLCASCAKQSKNWVRTVQLRQEDCVKHPAWQKAQALGFTRFLSEEELAKYVPAKTTYK